MRRFLFGLTALTMASGPALAGTISAGDGWFRALPGDLPAAGYVVLRNSGKTAVALTGAQSSACPTLMLHMTHQMDGMMHMMEVPKVEIAPGATLNLAPGGYHLMCMKPTLKPGTTVPVNLTFSDGTSLAVNFAVRNAQGK
ncbi:hypothetical protein FHS83_002221 [Rhizomicrobium palustre]|uniref:Copper chaperone PCu(A)C n=1 Tax=Rhizomicrobium palustre TaxID=189966 RepID=A0A846N019_9PROT|nr:copper chaperone PCu(A)C [Rhizomicrobium palustre]NIK88903.1 hypothetical protein [Rhizomicrobium palustre]